MEACLQRGGVVAAGGSGGVEKVSGGVIVLGTRTPTKESIEEEESADASQASQAKKKLKKFIKN